MQWLNPREATLWIRKHGQIEAPHHESLINPPEHHSQFYAPTTYGAIEGFVWQFVSEVIGEGEMLIQVVDWTPFTPARQYLIGRIWDPGVAQWDQSQVSACLLKGEEIGAAIGLFSLTSCFGWQAYLYGERDQIVLYNWEGEIWDTWTSSLSKAEKILEIIGRFPFEFVPED